MAVSPELSELLEVTDADNTLPRQSSDQAPARISSVDDCGLSGWYWYCTEHDAHGISDSEDEAVFVLDAHVEYHELHGRACPQAGLVVVFQQPAPEDEIPAGGSQDTLREIRL